MSTTISIVTAVFNGEGVVTNCLESVRSQTLSSEHIIIDGGSTDSTLGIAAGFPHVTKVVSEPDRGIYDAMNKGIKLATGEVVGLLNSDDFYASPDVLAKVSSVFDDPTVGACYGDLVYVEEIPGLAGARAEQQSGFKIVRYWKSGHCRKGSFHWGWMPPHPTFFVRRPVYEEFGLFNLNLGSAADYEIMLRFLLRHQIKAFYLPEVFVKMRIGGVSNASVSNRLKANRMDRKAWEVNGLKPHPWTLAMKPIRKIPQWWRRPN